MTSKHGLSGELMVLRAIVKERMQLAEQSQYLARRIEDEEYSKGQASAYESVLLIIDNAKLRSEIEPAGLGQR